MSEWKFRERVNSQGEWNPRLIACGNCGEYDEPENLKFWNYDTVEGGDYYCQNCQVEVGLTSETKSL